MASEQRLDPLAERCVAAVGRLSRSTGVEAALHGGWLGHALHPLLTDLTAGPWMAASLLDLFGPAGSEDAARRLVGFGLAAAVPTLLSGRPAGHRRCRTSRGPAARRHQRHLHGAVRLLLVGRRGDHRRGVVLGLVAGVIAFADGYVGGELSLVGRVGTGRRTRRR